MNILEDDKIKLFPINEEHTPLLVKWRNQEFMRRQSIVQEECTEEMHQNWLETMVKTKRVIQFIIYEKESDMPIGSLYLKDVDRQNRKAELGIFIGEAEYLGKHVGRRAIRLLLDYAFRAEDLNKIFLRLATGNERALRCYKSAGFEEEGVFKQDVKINGEFIDVRFMAVRRISC